jgi:predicted Zn-dependent protease
MAPLLLAGCAGGIDLKHGLSPSQAVAIGQAGKSVVQAAKPISEAEELQIGRAVAARVTGRYRLVGDAALNRYVSLVGRACAANSSRPQLPWRFAVLDTPEVNAFAAPGGYVFVSLGALRVMENEAQLAGVLSHEITHVANRHIIKEIQKGKWMEAGMSIADATGTIVADVLDSIAESAVGTLFEKGYSRSDEYESDNEGTLTLSRTGYAADGLLVFLQRLSKGKQSKGEMAVLFATHPNFDDRIGKVTETIADGKLVIKGRPTLENRFRKNL